MVVNVYQQVRDKVLAEEKQEAVGPEDTHDSTDKREAGDPLDSKARARLEKKQTSKRRLKHSSTTDLALASKRQQDELEFSTRIDKVMCAVAKAMELPWDQDSSEPSRQQE